MKSSELESILAVALPIFRKYVPDPTVTFASGRSPLNLQDFLLKAMSDEDRKALIAAGWKTNGALAWYYEMPLAKVVTPEQKEQGEDAEAIAARLRTGSISPPLLKSM